MQNTLTCEPIDLNNIMEISSGVRKGMWSKEEDDLLRTCIQRYGEGKWHLVPQRAGLNRCRKSCRMRWLNYLKPGIKRGNFSDDEADMILRFHKLLGNRWSLIASRFPGRTSNDLKNYWNTHIRKKMGCSPSQAKEEKKEAVGHKVITPQPLNLSRKGRLPDEAAVANACDGGVSDKPTTISTHYGDSNYKTTTTDDNDDDSGDQVGVVVADISAHQESAEKDKEWWERLLDDDLVINDEGNEKYSVPWSLSEEENKFLTQFWDDPNYLPVIL